MTYRSETEKRMLESLTRIPRHYELSLSREMDRLLQKLTPIREVEAVNRKIREAIATNTRATAAIDEINRRALESVAKRISRSHFEVSKQLAEEMRTVTERALHPGITTQIAALAHSMRSPDDLETSRFLNEVVESLNLIIVSLSEHTRENIRTSLAAFQFNAAWAALDTIQTLGSQQVDSSFSSFLAEVLNETQMLNESDPQQISPGLLARGMRSQISNEQLTVWLIVVSLLIALYSAIQTGRPVKVNSDQLVQIINRKSAEIRLHSEAENRYRVERASVLKARPRKKSERLGILVPHEKVRLMYRHHKWAFIEYFDRATDSVGYGWTYKKYLRPLANVQALRYLGNAPTDSLNSLTKEEQLAIDQHWDHTNKRRVELINKK